MKRRCGNCGAALGPNANFCRACGAQDAAPPVAVAKPATEQPHIAPSDQDPTPRRGRAALAVAVGVLLIGAGIAAAILLTSGDDPSTTTVVRSVAPPGRPSTPPNPGAAEAIEPGLYVQAGSFQTLSHARTEQQRLAAQGIEVEVLSSDLAQELYPGFQVLLGGPFESGAAEKALLQGLHRNGVPSAYARDLTPASGGDAEAAAGRWSGRLERTSSEHPNLNGTLSANLTLSPNVTTGSLDLPGIGCEASLTLDSSVGQVLVYSQEPSCAGAAEAHMRLAGDELMVTLLSPETDSFSLGTLSRG